MIKLKCFRFKISLPILRILLKMSLDPGIAGLSGYRETFFRIAPLEKYPVNPNIHASM